MLMIIVESPCLSREGVVNLCCCKAGRKTGNLCCCKACSWYMYGSFVPTSDARPFLIQRRKVCIYLARLGCVYVLLKAHVP